MTRSGGMALRYESLEHWRGLAALAVVLFHGFGERSGHWRRYALLPIMLAVIALLLDASEPRAVQMAGAALFALLLGYLQAYDRRIAGWRALRWLARVGSFSYSLYLVHVPIEGRVVNLLSRYVDAASPLFLFVQLAGLGAALAVAWAFFRVCEQPLERLRRRHAHSKEAARAARSAQAGLASRHRA